MADKTEARTRRSKARGKRRESVTEPFEELDRAAEQETSEGTSSQNGVLAGGAAKVVGTALAAAALGALGGAVKMLLERRGEEPRPSREQDSGEEDGATEDAGPAEADYVEEEADDPETAAVAEQADAQSRPEPEPDDDRDEASPEQADDEPPRQQASRQEPQETEGVSGDDGAEIVDQARRHLEQLLGAEAERVSGIHRANGAWAVDLEVVEVARIPESTDVLATYEVSLDDDGQLVSVNRTRRYRRSQIDEGS